ncbi:MAG: NUDIX hydrolase [Candidatus Staskawiczbacteria bacterium]|nr:NUDIX hydrolase [Candidatus Staskawiczbacteria bacterium]
MDTKEAIKFLDKQIKNPSQGLPEEIFLFASKIVPMVNVDLLIKDENGRTLLAWREDELYNGWHLPGGIIRFKEKMETRLKKVSKSEIGVMVKFDTVPIAINQIMWKKNIRGHFISILYKCFLSNSFIPKNKGLSNKDPGYLAWHDYCPKDLLKVQKIYKKYI